MSGHGVSVLMGILSPVPEVPQEVALSEEVVTSVFVNWRQPLGQVEGYKVGVSYNIVQIQVAITEGETGIKGCYAAITRRQM